MRLLPSTKAFTLVEVIVAISLAGLGVATTVAQNQIDLLISDSPFNPQKTNPDGSLMVPPELAVGTHVTNNVPIYKEPSTGVIVSGTLTTVITDISPTYNGFVVPIYQATVTVTYTYLSRSYSVTMDTIRTSDI